MLILALESAGPTASVALLREGALLAEISLHNTRTHSETLMPLAEEALRGLGLSPADIAAIAVDHGPGSFTGVRIGVCAANGMGQALGIPVVGVDSLRALYEPLRFLPEPVCTLIDARNQNAYAALYREGVCILEPAADAVEAILEHAPEGTIFVGDGATAYEGMILQAVHGAKIAPETPYSLRAGAVALAAERMLREAGTAEAADTATWQAVPQYLRPSQAERMLHEKRGAE